MKTSGAAAECAGGCGAAATAGLAEESKRRLLLKSTFYKYLCVCFLLVNEQIKSIFWLSGWCLLVLGG